MARRRAISEDLLYDKELNSVSTAAENLFFRMLAVADDCGIVPATEYTLTKMINLRPQLARKIDDLLHELVAASLGRVIEFDGRPFWAFKLQAFLRHQGHIINKRKRSEYLKISTEDYDSGKFPDFPGFSSSSVQIRLSGVESRKQKVESKEQKDTMPKVQFAELVMMTEAEYRKLVEKLKSESRAKRCIEILDNAKGSKGYKYLSDYRAILTWVVTELEKREAAEVKLGIRPGVSAPAADRNASLCPKCGSVHKYWKDCPKDAPAMTPAKADALAALKKAEEHVKV